MHSIIIIILILHQTFTSLSATSLEIWKSKNRLDNVKNRNSEEKGTLFNDILLNVFNNFRPSKNIIWNKKNPL